jgi:hypothetical protein
MTEKNKINGIDYEIVFYELESRENGENYFDKNT